MRGARAKVKIKAGTESLSARRPARAAGRLGDPLRRGGGRGGDGTQRAPPPRGARAPPLARAAPRATGGCAQPAERDPERRAPPHAQGLPVQRARGADAPEPAAPAPPAASAERPRQGAAPPRQPRRPGWGGRPPRALPAGRLPASPGRRPSYLCAGAAAGEGPQEPEALGSAWRGLRAAPAFPFCLRTPLPLGTCSCGAARAPGAAVPAPRALWGRAPGGLRSRVGLRAPAGPAVPTPGAGARDWPPAAARPLPAPPPVPGAGLPRQMPSGGRSTRRASRVRAPRGAPGGGGASCPPRTLPAPPLWGPRKWAADGAGRQSPWGACARPRRGAAGGPYPRRR